MNVLIKKLQKSNKIALIAFFLVFLAYIVSLSFFTSSMLSLSGIETVLRFILLIVLYIWFIFYGLVALASLVKSKWKTFIPITILSIILIIMFSVGAYLIDVVYDNLSGVNNEYTTYTSNLINMRDSTFGSDSKIGMISDVDDIEGNILAKILIDKEKINNEVVEYDDYYVMLYDLYEGRVDAILISSNYTVIFSGEEMYENISDDTKIVFEYSEKMKNKDNELSSNKSLSEPFSILLMGVDSSNDGLLANQAFNGDTLMLITFNPSTMSATMFSMPRDLYVPIACRGNASAKINSSAASGTACVINTVTNLTDVKIDYYMKINFKGAVDLVDTLNGVTVDVEPPNYNTYNGQVCEQNSMREFGNKLICMDPGIQKLNGEQALAYARCRHLYTQSDIARNRHQQQLVEAVFNEIKNIRSFSEIEKLLEAISRNIETNMNTNQILSFYNVAKDLLVKSDNNLTIQKTYLEYYDLPVYMPGSGQVTSALGYYEASLDAIKYALRVNLELEEAKMIKTASFSYNEEYNPGVIGQGITDSSRKEVVPNFKGNYVSYATDWANARGINISVETAEYGSSNFNLNYGAGVIGNQSVPYGTFVSNVNNIIIYVNGSYTPQEESTPNEVGEVQSQDNPLEESGILPN